VSATAARPSPRGRASAQDLSQPARSAATTSDANDVGDINLRVERRLAWKRRQHRFPPCAQLVDGFVDHATKASPGSTPGTTRSTTQPRLTGGRRVDHLIPTRSPRPTITARRHRHRQHHEQRHQTMRQTVSATGGTAFHQAGDARRKDLSRPARSASTTIDDNDVVDITFASNADIAGAGQHDPAPPTPPPLGAQMVAVYRPPHQTPQPRAHARELRGHDANLDSWRPESLITFLLHGQRDRHKARTTDTVTSTINGPTMRRPGRDGGPRPFTERAMRARRNLSQAARVTFNDIDANDVVDITFESNENTLERRQHRSSLAHSWSPVSRTTATSRSPGQHARDYAVKDAQHTTPGGRRVDHLLLHGHRERHNARQTPTPSPHDPRNQRCADRGARGCSAFTEAGDASAPDFSQGGHGQLQRNRPPNESRRHSPRVERRPRMEQGCRIDPALAAQLFAVSRHPPATNAAARAATPGNYAVNDANSIPGGRRVDHLLLNGHATDNNAADRHTTQSTITIQRHQRLRRP